MYKEIMVHCDLLISAPSNILTYLLFRNYDKKIQVVQRVLRLSQSVELRVQSTLHQRDRRMNSESRYHTNGQLQCR